MNNNFAKTALAISIAAAAAYSQNGFAASQPAQAGDTVVIGCSVPASGTAGGTVYIVDATSSVSTSATTYTISLPSAVAAGQSCAAAIQSLTGAAAPGASTIFFHPVNPTAGLVNNVTATAESVVVPGTGYGLVAHTYTANTSGVAKNSPIFVGCTAGTTTAGSTVYSVDTSAVTEPANIGTIQGLIGKPCSQGLAGVVTSGSSAFFNNGWTNGGATNVTIPTAGYGLNLYTIQ